MSSQSAQKLRVLLDDKSVVVLSEMQEALEDASRATVFRHLTKVNYRRSYNYNGRYYTRYDPTRYDEHGLFSYKGIHFSREGNLGATVSRLICESAAGQTQRELQDLLRVRVQTVVLKFIRHEKIAREIFEGLYLYLHPDTKTRTAQLDRRRELLEAHRFETEKVTDAVVIEILLVLIRYPGSRVGDVSRRLKGRSPPITMQHVRVVFDRYGLDDVGEKGGPSRR